MILQIHDEFVFEAPEPADRFIREMKKVLEQPPTSDFRVPIIVEAKIGERFGDLHELEAWRLSDSMDRPHLACGLVETETHLEEHPTQARVARAPRGRSRLCTRNRLTFTERRRLHPPEELT